VAAVVLAAGGVLLIADVRWSASTSGLVWALAAAAMWAAYIVLGKRVAAAGNGVDDMAVGFFVASVVLSPLVFLTGYAPLAALADPVVLLLAVGVGVLSSVIPYGLDQVVLKRVGQARFAVLLALLPATATVIGVVALGQVPGGAEAVGIAAVIAAVALRSRDGDVPEGFERPPVGRTTVTQRDTRPGDLE
jgi:inner membrane transporter RhtA